MKIHTRNPHGSAGFSLIELVIVLAGAGILAALCIPSLLDMRNNYNTVFAAQEISTHLQFARLKAVSSNEAMRVNFINNGSYQVELADGTRVQGPFPYPSGMSLANVTFGGNYVTFQPDGTVPASGNGSIGMVKLTSTNGLAVDVNVNGSGVITRSTPYRCTS